MCDLARGQRKAGLIEHCAARAGEVLAPRSSNSRCLDRDRTIDAIVAEGRGEPGDRPPHHQDLPVHVRKLPQQAFQFALRDPITIIHFRLLA